MASDLKIEIFAYNVFRNLWNMFNVANTLPNVLEVYGDECNKVKDYMEALDNQFCSVILVRYSIFKNIYRTNFKDELVQSLTSLFDFCRYVFHRCKRDDLFSNLTIFQRVFATITFVFIGYRRRHKINNTIDIVKYGHVFWAMYFGNFLEEFYDKGGWIKLKTEAESYKYLFEFNSAFKNCLFYLKTLKQATDNYLRFMFVVTKEQKRENLLHLSKLWIVFRSKHFSRYIPISIDYEVFLNKYDAEILLKDVKQAFNISRCSYNNNVITKEKVEESTLSSTMLYSEVNDTYEEIKNTDVKKIQSFISEHANRLLDKISDFSNSDSGSANQCGIKNPISEHQEKHEESSLSSTMFDSEVNDNYEDIKNTDLQQIQSFISEHAKSLLDKISDFSNSDSGSANEGGIRNPISEHQELTFDVTNRNENFETDKNTLTEMDSPKINSSKDLTENSQMKHILPLVNRSKQPEILENAANVANLAYSCRNKSFVNEDKDGTIENFNKGNIQEQDKTQTTDPMLTVNKTGETASSENVSAVKDFISSSEDVNSDNESVNIEKAREDLRKEQKDSEMKSFLKMLLVLDDKEETKVVFSTLQNAGNPENSQESFKKKKKKSKKKSKKDFNHIQ